jgi:hypothetical protein
MWGLTTSTPLIRDPLVQNWFKGKHHLLVLLFQAKFLRMLTAQIEMKGSQPIWQRRKCNDLKIALVMPIRVCGNPQTVQRLVDAHRGPPLAQGQRPIPHQINKQPTASY